MRTRDDSPELSRLARRSLPDSSQSREEFIAANSRDWENALGATAEFTGTLIVEDNVRLEGNFKGELQTRGTVHVVSGAQVNADIQAGFAVIDGAYQGELHCEQRIDLLSSCRAQGKLITKRLKVEDGALFDGEVEMTRNSSAKDATNAEAFRGEDAQA